MKKIILIALLILIFNFSKGQVYPFAEDLNAMAPNTTPSGNWIST